MYTRVFHSILDSSVWMLDPEVRVVWMTMLLLADDARTGIVDMPIASLSRRANLSERTVRKALDVLMSPDPLSGDPEDEGRRVRSLNGNPDRGWLLVNWEKYKTSGNAEARKEQVKEATRRWRERGGDTTVNTGDTPVIAGDTSEAEAEAEAEAIGTPSLPSTGESPPPGGARVSRTREPFVPPTLGQVEGYALLIDARNASPTEFHAYWTEENWINSKGRKVRDWKKAFRNRERNPGPFGRPRAAKAINPDVIVGKTSPAYVEFQNAEEKELCRKLLNDGKNPAEVDAEILARRSRAS